MEESNVEVKADKVHDKLKDLTDYNYNYLAKRGNDAILKALKIVKELGYKKVYIADQGGWLTYKHHSEKLKLKLHELKTDFGLVPHESLKKVKDAILILSASPAYIAFQSFEKIMEIAKKNNIIVIEDMTATIGEQPNGDIVVVSFSKTKPADYGKLGMIAFEDEKFNKTEILDDSKIEYDEKELLYRLENIDFRKETLKKIAKGIKEDLADFEIIHKDYDGINVIVKFKTPEEKKALIEYCNKNKYDYKECPLYIKVLDNAIAIDVKKGTSTD